MAQQRRQDNCRSGERRSDRAGRSRHRRPRDPRLLVADERRLHGPRLEGPAARRHLPIADRAQAGETPTQSSAGGRKGALLRALLALRRRHVARRRADRPGSPRQKPRRRGVRPGRQPVFLLPDRRGLPLLHLPGRRRLAAVVRPARAHRPRGDRPRRLEARPPAVGGRGYPVVHGKGLAAGICRRRRRDGQIPPG